jgi:hypothetical protein
VRQALHEEDVVGDPPLGDPTLQESEQRLGFHLRAGLPHDDQQRALVPLGVLHADHGGLGDLGVRHGVALDVDGADPFAAGLDHVLGPVGDLHVAVGVDGGDVARGKPAVAQNRPAGLLEVAVDHPVAADLQVAEGDAVVGKRGVARARDPEVDAEHRPALLLAERIAGRLVPAAMLRLEGFTVPSGLNSVMPQACSTSMPWRSRKARIIAGGAAAPADHHALQRARREGVLFHVLQQGEPDGRHARREGHALGLEELEEARAVEVGARQDQLGARHRRRHKGCPGVDVEHGDHGKHDLGGGQAEGVRHAHGKAVQQRRAVRVERALWDCRSCPRCSRGWRPASSEISGQSNPAGRPSSRSS